MNILDIYKTAEKHWSRPAWLCKMFGWNYTDFGLCYYFSKKHTEYRYSHYFKEFGIHIKQVKFAHTISTHAKNAYKQLETLLKT
jgi:hypothetical protein